MLSLVPFLCVLLNCLHVLEFVYCSKTIAAARYDKILSFMVYFDKRGLGSKLTISSMLLLVCNSFFSISSVRSYTSMSVGV